MNDAVHWSDEQYFGTRAHFKIGSDSTVLIITKVKLEVNDHLTFYENNIILF
jgi:hypothetical protein